MNCYYLLTVPLLLVSIFNKVVSQDYFSDSAYSKYLPSFLGNFIKIFISLLFLKKIHQQNKHVFTVTVLYKLQTVLITMYTKQASPAYISICQQSKIVFLALLSMIILKRRYNKIQFLGYFIVLLGLACGNYGFSESKKDSQEVFGGLLLANFFASFGAVYFEKHIRRKIEDFNGYYLKFTMFNVLLTSLFLGYEMFDERIQWAYNFKSPLLYSTFASFFVLSYLTTLFSSKVCSVKRSFISMLISSLAGILGNLCMGVAVNGKEYLSFFVISLGFLISEYKNVYKMMAELRK